MYFIGCLFVTLFGRKGMGNQVEMSSIRFTMKDNYHLFSCIFEWSLK